jgi:flagellar basal-body rod protein FlgB
VVQAIEQRENPWMDLDLTLLTLASRLAAHSTARQSLIAQNVAHADTPGYRARDLEAFAPQAERPAAAPFAARVTRPGHAAFGAEAAGFAVREAHAPGSAAPNGNTVSLEDQMMRAAGTRSSHDLALGVYGKSLEILRAGLGRGR